MKTIQSLLLIIGMAFCVLLLTDQLKATPAQSVMISGLLVMGAWLTGRIFAQIKLPRISGYLLFGLAVGPSFYNILPTQNLPQWFNHAMPLVSDQQLNGLVFIKDLAISLIAITAGGEIKIDWLRKQLKSVLALTFASVLLVWILLAGGIFAIQHFTQLQILTPANSFGILIPLLFISLIGTGNSPSVAIAMITECKASGPMSRTLLAVTVCKDLLIVILFATLMAVSKGLLDTDQSLSATFIIAIIAQLGGSIILGIILGLVMALFINRVQHHLVFFIIGACFLFALLGEQHFTLLGHNVHIEVLLLTIAAGMTMQNVTPKISAPLFHTIEEMSIPIYCMFFAVAGAQLNLDVFTTPQAVAAIFIIVFFRAFFIWFSVSATAKLLKLDPVWRNKLWLNFTPQAGITLALAVLLLQSFTNSDGSIPKWVTDLNTIILGLVAIHAFLGPILTRLALVWSKEANQSQPDESNHIN